jgi:hypothetical protein
VAIRDIIALECGMESRDFDWATLVPHAATGAALEITGAVRIESGGVAQFRYVARAAPECVRVPVESTPDRRDGLWKHTCFEAFLMTPGSAQYYELNFAPSRQWAVYHFQSYRAGMASPELDGAPEISVRRTSDRLELDAAVRLLELTALAGARRLLVALNAVVEDADGSLSYWALKHAPGRADFHDPAGFVLELAI